MAGLPRISYKMAVTNPRNSINLDDALETVPIRIFNEDWKVTSYQEIQNRDEKH